MKIIRNKYIISGLQSNELFGVLSEECRIDDITLNHEKIHTAQIKELWYVFFYLWYIIEWLIRLFMKGDAYRNISFEKEAYNNENDLNYLHSRKRFGFAKYIKTRV